MGWAVSAFVASGTAARDGVSAGQRFRGGAAPTERFGQTVGTNSSRAAAGDRGSYGAGFSENSRAVFFWQPAGCQHIHAHAQDLPQFHANGTDVKERRLWRWVNEDVEVAVFCVAPVEHRAEHASIACTVGLHHRANSCAVCMKGIRGLHGKDRITTNGSCTRRHAEQKTAWRFFTIAAQVAQSPSISSKLVVIAAVLASMMLAEQYFS